MITYLELKNFKCFDNLEIDLAPITLITGINGMGKSSVIQSLLMLRQSFDERYLQTEDKILLNGQLTKLVSGEDLRYVLADTLLTTINLEFSDSLEATWNIKAEGSKELLSCEQSDKKSVYDENLFKDNFQYICAERLGPRMSYDKTLISKHKGRLGTGNTELTASFLYKCLSENKKLPVSNLKYPGLKSDLIYDNTNAWLSHIGYEGASVSANEITQNKIELRYSFARGKFSGKDFSPVNVGFGFSYVLPVILSVLSAEPGSLILVENPEAHLHPAAQSKIGKLLALAAQNDIQIVVETHSDHFLNGIRVGVRKKTIEPTKVLIHYFNSELVDDVDRLFKETIKILPDGKIDEWPRNFFDEWDNNLMQLI